MGETDAEDHYVASNGAFLGFLPFLGPTISGEDRQTASLQDIRTFLTVGIGSKLGLAEGTRLRPTADRTRVCSWATLPCFSYLLAQVAASFASSPPKAFVQDATSRTLPLVPLVEPWTTLLIHDNKHSVRRIF